MAVLCSGVRPGGPDRLVDHGPPHGERSRSPILPAITFGLFQMTLIMRLVRSEMLEVLRTDYIRFARARGLPNRTIHFGHALKNTLVSVITIAGLQLGTIIAFALITETVFQWPGMGLMFFGRHLRRHPGHGGLSSGRGLLLPGDQPARRHAVRSSIRGCGDGSGRGKRPWALMERLHLSPPAVLAGLVTLICGLRRAARTLDRSPRPIRPCQPSPDRRVYSASLERSGQRRLSCSARTPRAGTAGQPHPVRPPHFAGGRSRLRWRPRLGSCLGCLRLSWRPARCVHHARRRHPAQLPGHPHRAAHRRGGARAGRAHARHLVPV